MYVPKNWIILPCFVYQWNFVPYLTTVPIPVAARFKAWVGVKQTGWTRNLCEGAEKDYEKPNDSQCPGSHSTLQDPYTNIPSSVSWTNLHVTNDSVAYSTSFKPVLQCTLPNAITSMVPTERRCKAFSYFKIKNTGPHTIQVNSLFPGDP
jgi:hypothetical protein